LLLQVAIGGGNHPHVGTTGAIFADALVRFFLQHAEQFTLQVQRHFADFVEKIGPAFGGFEAAGAVFDSPGESQSACRHCCHAFQ
jgi:hypothetical protein